MTTNPNYCPECGCNAAHEVPNRIPLGCSCSKDCERCERVANQIRRSRAARQGHNTRRNFTGKSWTFDEELPA